MGTVSCGPMASIEYRSSGPRIVWRLNRPGDPEHQRKQHFECEEDVLEDALSILEGHKRRLTRDELEALVLGANEDEVLQTASTFRTWAEETWLPSRTRIGPRTRGDYRRMFAYRIFPAFGDKPIDSFKPSIIGTWINSMRAENLSERTITRHYSLVFQVFGAAVKNGLIPANPCDDTDFVRDQTADDDQGDEDHVYLTPEEYQILYRAIPDSYKDFVEALVATAGRFGEITALQPRDRIAPSRREPQPRLWIRRAWKQDETGGWYLGTTKGRASRKNRIDDALDELLLRRSEDRAPDDLLFTAPGRRKNPMEPSPKKGGRLTHHNFVSRVWNPAVVRAMRCPEHPPPAEASPLAEPTGVCGDHGGRSRTTGQPCQRRWLVSGLDRCKWHAGPAPDATSDCDCPDVLHRRLTPHDLRHTAAAWMFANPDVNPLYVSRYLGHASTGVTDKVYAGLVPSGESAAVSALARARGRDGKGEEAVDAVGALVPSADGKD
jgi:integrase